MKYVYNYDKETGEFLTAEPADLDPEESRIQEKEIYLLPAHATFIEPPIAKERRIAIFNKNTQKWSLRSDMRGTLYYRSDGGKRHEITKIGKRVPKDYILDAPPEDLRIPKYDKKLKKWTEGAIIYQGRICRDAARVKLLTSKRMREELGEDKVKTLKLIAGTGPCPEWDEFLIKREEILQESDDFITNNKLK